MHDFLLSIISSVADYCMFCSLRHYVIIPILAVFHVLFKNGSLRGFYSLELEYSFLLLVWILLSVLNEWCWDLVLSLCNKMV